MFLHAVETEIKNAYDDVKHLVGEGASAFEIACAKQIKAELPLITCVLYAKVKQIFGEAAAVVEKQAKAGMSGDEKWTAAMSHAIAGIEKIGLNAASLSATTKESLLQAAVMVVKAGLAAAVL